MKIDFSPFQIGMQYEDWEFDLEPEDVTRKYDKYKYFKNDIKAIFNQEIKNIYLYFELDILFKVEVFFKSGNSPYQFINVDSILDEKYGREILYSNKEKQIIYKKWKDVEKTVILLNDIGLNSVCLTVINNKYIL